LTRLANCCNPLPGDAIVGFVSRGKGVIVHRHDCRNIANFVNEHRERLINVNWLVEYPQTDGRERENLIPFPLPPDRNNANGMTPNMSGGFALGVSLQHYHVPIIITAHDRSDLIRDVATVVSDVGAHLSLINSRTRRGTAVIMATIDIESMDMLYRLFTKLGKTKGITHVERDLGKKR